MEMFFAAMTIALWIAYGAVIVFGTWFIVRQFWLASRDQ